MEGTDGERSCKHSLPSAERMGGLRAGSGEESGSYRTPGLHDGRGKRRGIPKKGIS